jgi:hypothetical protein
MPRGQGGSHVHRHTELDTSERQGPCAFLVLYTLRATFLHACSMTADVSQLCTLLYGSVVVCVVALTTVCHTHASRPYLLRCAVLLPATLCK